MLSGVGGEACQLSPWGPHRPSPSTSKSRNSEVLRSHPGHLSEVVL